MKINSVVKMKQVAWATGILLALILLILVSESGAKPSPQAPPIQVMEVAAAVIAFTLWLQSAGIAALIAWVRVALVGDGHQMGELRPAALIVRFAAAVVVLHGMEILLWACE